MNDPKLFTRVYGLMAAVLLVFGAWMIYKNPDGAGGWVTAILATLQLIISKVGELARLAFGVSLEPQSGAEKESVLPLTDVVP